MDAADHEIIIAGITTLGLLLVAVVPLAWADRNARRRTHEHLVELHRKSDQLLEVTNSVHDEEQVDGDGMTLGKLLRQVDEQVTDGFERNDQTHDDLRELIRQNSQRLQEHSGRLDRLDRHSD